MSSGTLLLRQAISYARRSVLDVSPALLPRPTPCRDWDLDMLLRHTCESLAALGEGAVTGRVALIPASQDRDPADEPARAFGERAGLLLAAQAGAGCERQVIDIGGLPLPAIAMECAGAIEIAVHGWDIAAACGQRRPIPDALAIGLLAVAPLLVPEAGREPQFGPPVRTTAGDSPGDCLVAFLGREPSSAPPPAGTADRRASAGGDRPGCRSERPDR